MKKNRLLPLLLCFLLAFALLFVCSCKEEEDIPLGFHFELQQDTNTYILTRYIGKEEDIYVPSEYNGLPVTAIASRAFENCVSMRTIFIPRTITTIGSYAFSGCVLLENIRLPYQLERIEEGLFYNCSNLRDVWYPDEIDEIPAYTFYGCKTLKAITISDKINKVGIKAFGRCENLKIYIENELIRPRDWATDWNASSCPVVWGYIDKFTSGGYTYIKTVDGLTLVDCTDKDDTSVRVPQSVEGTRVFAIGENAFFGMDNLKEITVFSGVVEIRNRAFAGCKSLQYVVIPETVLTIAQDAFYGDYSLREICYTGSEEMWGQISGYQLPPYGTLVCNYCYGLTTHRQSSGIGISGIGICDKTELNIPSYYIGNKVVGIEAEAFINNENITSIVVPEGVTYIDSKAFYGCRELKGIVLPDTLQRIGQDAFTGVPKEAFTVYENGYYLGSEKNPYLVFVSPVSTKKEVVIHPSTKIIQTEFTRTIHTIPSFFIDEGNPYYKTIDGILYQQMEGLHLIAYPKGSTATTVTLPMGVVSIPALAFYGSPYLENLILPESVTGIANNAFYSTPKLESIHLPSGVKYLSISTFANCKNLKSITVDEENLTFLSDGGVLYTKNTNASTVTTTLLFYPPSREEKEYTVRKDCNIIEPSAFRDCTIIETVHLPEGLKTIKESAFSGCTSLKDIVFPESLQTIESQAFSGCKAFLHLKAPSRLRTLGESAFSHCFYLQDAILPLSLTTFGENVFNGCSNLASIAYSGSEEQWQALVKEQTFSCDITFHFFLTEELIYELDANGEYMVIGARPYTNHEVRIPTTYNGIPITKIAPNAFAENNNISKVIIPEGIHTIGEYAFRACNNLLVVTIPDSVTTIGNGAFLYCSKLTIYATAPAKPESWHEKWKSNNCPVVWNYREE